MMKNGNRIFRLSNQKYKSFKIYQTYFKLS